METNHTYTTEIHFVRADVRERKVSQVAVASVAPLVGEAEVVVIHTLGNMVALTINFYGLNDTEARRTAKVMASAIRPLVASVEEDPLVGTI